LLDTFETGALETARLTRRELEQLLASWTVRAQDYQYFPGFLDGQSPWAARPTWLLLGGRGAGKTRTGAEWIRGFALGLTDFADAPLGRLALVGETFAQARDVMVEGPAGILAIHRRAERPLWSPSLRKLEWPSTGAVAHVFSAEDPDSLRGPQFEAAWADELAKWRHVEEAWDMLQFGLRLGAHPREIVTTTPRPIPLIKRLLADPRIAVSRARTAENAQNLAPSFLDAVVGRYAGTRLGRQELDGEIIDDRPDALWTRATVEACRVAGAACIA
jgi:phage terminase large subunit-like protein